MGSTGSARAPPLLELPPCFLDANRTKMDAHAGPKMDEHSPAASGRPVRGGKGEGGLFELGEGGRGVGMCVWSNVVHFAPLGWECPKNIRSSTAPHANARG